MSGPDLERLSRRERQLMNLLFREGEMTAKELWKALPDPPSYATVRSILRILEEKGHLTRRKEGRQFCYRATASPEQVRPKSLRGLIRNFFGGSLTTAVATFLSDPEADLSDTELDKLEQLVAKAKERARQRKESSE